MKLNEEDYGVDFLKKVDYSLELIRKAGELAKKTARPLIVAFSGGKDSVVLYKLTQMAGVEFESAYNVTTIDPPENLHFIKKEFPDVKIVRPPKGMSIFRLAEKKGILPTRMFRWCCSEFKEYYGADGIVLTGVRRSESARRAKRKAFQVGKSKILNYDSVEEIDSECYSGKEKIVVNPLIYWNDEEVWRFITLHHLPVNILYQTQSRVGCIGCPMSSTSKRWQDFQSHPYIKKRWLETITKIKNSKKPQMGVWQHPVAKIFEWWLKEDKAVFDPSLFDYRFNKL